jgi:hypothetical protein
MRHCGSHLRLGRPRQLSCSDEGWCRRPIDIRYLRGGDSGGPDGEYANDHLVINGYRTFEFIGRREGRHTKDHLKQFKRDVRQESRY